MAKNIVQICMIHKPFLTGFVHLKISEQCLIHFSKPVAKI